MSHVPSYTPESIKQLQEQEANNWLKTGYISHPDQSPELPNGEHPKSKAKTRTKLVDLIF